jgi:hypothetical protein
LPAVINQIAPEDRGCSCQDINFHLQFSYADCKSDMHQHEHKRSCNLQ